MGYEAGIPAYLQFTPDAPKETEGGFLAGVAKFLGSKTMSNILDNVAKTMQIRGGRDRGVTQYVQAKAAETATSKFLVSAVAAFAIFALLLWVAKAGILVSLLVGAGIFIAAPVILT